MSSIAAVLDEVPRETAAEVESVFDRLWPLLRSITGEGAKRGLHGICVRERVTAATPSHAA